MRTRKHDPEDFVLTAEEVAEIKRQRIGLGLSQLDCALVLNTSKTNYGHRERGTQKFYDSDRRKLQVLFSARAKENAEKAEKEAAKKAPGLPPELRVLTAEEVADIKRQRIELGLDALDCGIVLGVTSSGYHGREIGRIRMREHERQKLMKFFGMRRADQKRSRP